jgi:hypothetical protein
MILRRKEKIMLSTGIVLKVKLKLAQITRNRTTSPCRVVEEHEPEWTMLIQTTVADLPTMHQINHTQ